MTRPEIEIFSRCGGLWITYDADEANETQVFILSRSEVANRMSELTESMQPRQP